MTDTLDPVEARASIDGRLHHQVETIVFRDGHFELETRVGPKGFIHGWIHVGGLPDRTKSYRHRDLHAEGEWPKGHNPRYGAVTFNKKGQVLLREPTNHYDGYAWTFPKGGPEKGEHPVDSALRETLEETGHVPKIVGHIPGKFSGSGTGSANHFYLAQDTKGMVDPSAMVANGETNALKWADPVEALNLISQSSNLPGRYRDLQTLKAAYDSMNAKHGGHFPNIVLPPPPPKPPKWYPKNVFKPTDLAPAAHVGYSNSKFLTSFSTPPKPSSKNVIHYTPPKKGSAAAAMQKAAVSKSSPKVKVTKPKGPTHLPSDWASEYDGDIEYRDSIHGHHIAGTTYHWKHGYIPLDDFAKIQLAKKGIGESHIPTYKAAAAAAYKKYASDEQDSVQIKAKAAPFYVKAKKALAAGDHETAAQHIGTAHGIQEAGRDKKLMEKEAGVTPHAKQAVGKGGVAKGSVSAPKITPVDANPSPDAPKKDETPSVPETKPAAPTASEVQHQKAVKNLMEHAPPGGWTEADKVPKEPSQATAQASVSAPSTGKTPADNSKYMKNSPKYKAFNEGHAQATKMAADQNFGASKSYNMEAQALNQAKAIKPSKGNTDKAKFEGQAAGFAHHGDIKNEETATKPSPKFATGKQAGAEWAAEQGLNQEEAQHHAAQFTTKAESSGHLYDSGFAAGVKEYADDEKNFPSPQNHGGSFAQPAVPNAGYSTPEENTAYQNGYEQAMEFAKNPGGSAEGGIGRKAAQGNVEGLKSLLATDTSGSSKKAAFTQGKIDAYTNYASMHEEEPLAAPSTSPPPAAHIPTPQEVYPDTYQSGHDHAKAELEMGALSPEEVKAQVTDVVGKNPDVSHQAYQAGALDAISEHQQSHPAAPSTEGSLPTSSSAYANAEKISGPTGSNPAQWYKMPDSSSVIVKQSPDPEHAFNEVAVNEVYKAAGIKTPQVGLVDNGEAVASKKVEGLTPWKTTPKNQEEARKGFGIDALTSNWDALGLVDDNAFTDKNGNVVRIDNGGGGMFRAMGTPKGNAFKTGDWNTNKAEGNAQLNDYNTLLHSEQGKKLYGADSNMSDSVKGQIDKSLDEAANLNLDDVAIGMSNAGIPTKFLANFLSVLHERQTHLKSLGYGGEKGVTQAEPSVSTPTPLTHAPVTFTASPSEPGHVISPAGVTIGDVQAGDVYDGVHVDSISEPNGVGYQNVTLSSGTKGTTTSSFAKDMPVMAALNYHNAKVAQSTPSVSAPSNPDVGHVAGMSVTPAQARKAVELWDQKDAASSNVAAFKGAGGYTIWDALGDAGVPVSGDTWSGTKYTDAYKQLQDIAANGSPGIAPSTSPPKKVVTKSKVMSKNIKPGDVVEGHVPVNGLFLKVENNPHGTAPGIVTGHQVMNDGTVNTNSPTISFPAPKGGQEKLTKLLPDHPVMKAMNGESTPSVSAPQTSKPSTNVEDLKTAAANSTETMEGLNLTSANHGKGASAEMTAYTVGHNVGKPGGLHEGNTAQIPVAVADYNQAIKDGDFTKAANQLGFIHALQEGGPDTTVPKMIHPVAPNSYTPGSLEADQYDEGVKKATSVLAPDGTFKTTLNQNHEQDPQGEASTLEQHIQGAMSSYGKKDDATSKGIVAGMEAYGGISPDTHAVSDLHEGDGLGSVGDGTVTKITPTDKHFTYDQSPVKELTITGPAGTMTKKYADTFPTSKLPDEYKKFAQPVPPMTAWPEAKTPETADAVKQAVKRYGNESYFDQEYAESPTKNGSEYVAGYASGKAATKTMTVQHLQDFVDYHESNYNDEPIGTNKEAREKGLMDSAKHQQDSGENPDESEYDEGNGEYDNPAATYGWPTDDQNFDEGYANDQLYNSDNTYAESYAEGKAAAAHLSPEELTNYIGNNENDYNDEPVNTTDEAIFKGKMDGAYQAKQFPSESAAPNIPGTQKASKLLPGDTVIDPHDGKAKKVSTVSAEGGSATDVTFTDGTAHLFGSSEVLQTTLATAASTAASVSTPTPPTKGKKTFTHVMAKNLKPGDQILHKPYAGVSEQKWIVSAKHKNGALEVHGPAGNTDKLSLQATDKVTKLALGHPQYMEPENGGAIPSVSPPANFKVAFQKAEKLKNLGKTEALPQKSTVLNLPSLSAYQIGHDKAVKAASGLPNDQIAQHKADAEDRQAKAISSSEQAAYAGMAHGFHEATQAKVEKQAVEDTTSTDVTTLPVYAKELAAAEAKRKTGATSQDLYAIAGPHAEDHSPEGQARYLAYQKVAEQADFEEGEKPTVAVDTGAPALTPAQIDYMTKKAKEGKGLTPKSSTATPLEIWAYDQGRAIGINTGNNAAADKHNTHSAADIEKAALQNEEAAKKAVGAVESARFQGIARGLHRVALAKHNGDAEEESGSLIKTGQSTDAAKPDVKYHPPGYADVGSINVGQYTAIVPFTSKEVEAIGQWTTDYRYKDQTPFLQAVNIGLEGKKAKVSDIEAQYMSTSDKQHAIDEAETFMHMADTKSVPSAHTIYRGTSGKEWTSGQLASWKAQIAQGKTVDFSMPVSSSTYDPNIWNDMTYRYVIDPGALTVDIGKSSNVGHEIETVTGGLMEVYDIGPNPVKPGQTLIKMRQVSHYAH